MDIIKQITFVRFCIASAEHLGLTTEQLICLYKECFEMAKYYNDISIMINSSVLLAVISSTNREHCDDAILYSKWCIYLAKIAGNKKMEMMAHQILFQKYQSMQQYDYAVLHNEKYIDLAKIVGNINAETMAHLNLGKTYHSMEQYVDAIRHSKKCIELSKVFDAKNVETVAHLNLGVAYQSMLQYGNAVLHSKQCIDLAKKVGDKNTEMTAHLNLGKTFHSMEQYDDAVLHSEKCIDLSKTVSDRNTEMMAHINLAKTYHFMKKYDDAVLHSKKCIDLAEIVGNINAKIAAHFELGKTYHSMEQYDDAALHSKKCIDLSKKVGDRSTEIVANYNLGETYRSMQRYDDAVLHCKKCIDLATETKMKREEETRVRHAEMKSYMALESAYNSLNKYDDAVACGKKYLEMAKKTGNKQDEMYAHLRLGTTFNDSCKLSSCCLHINEGMSIAVELKDNKAKEKFKELLANFYAYVGVSIKSYTYDIPASFNKFKDQVLRSEKEIVDDLDQAMKTNDEDRQSNLLFILYKHHTHKRQYEQAVKPLEQLKELQTRSENKLSVCTEMGALYLRMKQNKKALQSCEDGLTLVKKCNHYTFYQLNFYTRIGKIYHINGKLNLAEQYLGEAIRCFETLFATLGSHERFKISIVDKYIECYKTLSITLISTNQAKKALLILERCRARALKDLLITNYGVRQEENDEDHIKYSDVESLLSSSKFSILYYSVCFNNLLTFSVKDESDLQCSHKPLKIFEKKVLHFIDKVFDAMQVRQVIKCENRCLDTEQESNQKQVDDENESVRYTDEHIEETVMQPRLLSLDSNKGTSECSDLYDADFSLQFLYHALIDEAKDCLEQDEIVIIPDGPLCKVPFAALRDPVTGRYLSEITRIRLAPSITTLKLLQELPENYHCKKGKLIIGDPLVGKVMFDGKETEIPSLENAFFEAIAINSIFYGAATLLTGEEATKPAVIEKLQQGVSVVHIAAHGILSKATIVLAPSPETRETKIPDEEDYMLTMADVQNTQVRAQLVVLSCCHSGRGEIRAEGVVGMCRAFLASGARAVVASLWAIDDEATLEFMTKFYLHLRDGKSASTSLQQAMNEMRNTSKYNEPKYWAPFFLMGDDVTIKC